MNKILPREGITYDGPNIVVCEGYSDTRFLKHLLDIRGIESFEIGCPTQKQEGVLAGGRSGIAEYLTAIQVHRTRAKHGLTSLAVMLDADEVPGAAFDDATAWLTEVGFQAPQVPFEWTSTDDIPRTAVLVVPGSGLDGTLKAGTLEHLLWEAVRQTDQNTFECVEAFALCLGGHEGWSSNKQAKLRIHATIAGRCRNDPASSLSRVWSNDPVLFPLDHALFDFIGNLFSEVATAE